MHIHTPESSHIEQIYLNNWLGVIDLLFKDTCTLDEIGEILELVKNDAKIDDADRYRRLQLIHGVLSDKTMQKDPNFRYGENPDFSRDPCDFAHERVPGNTKDTIEYILRCPFNLAGNSPWCAHGHYHGFSYRTSFLYLSDLGVSQNILDDFNQSFWITSILDITARIPKKGSISDNDTFNFEDETSRLENYIVLIESQKLTLEEREGIRSLLKQAQNLLTGNPLVDDVANLFIEKYWSPVRKSNELRQTRIQLAVRSAENMKAGLLAG